MERGQWEEYLGIYLFNSVHVSLPLMNLSANLTALNFEKVTLDT
jgi:hypothetical protein